MPYTIQLMKGIHLYQRPLQLQTRTGANSNNNLNQAALLQNLSYPSATVPSPCILNGSKFLQTPATLSSKPKVVPVNTPYHRSVSQPNVALNRMSSSDSRRNEADFVHRGPVKTKLALCNQSQRANLPYSRTSTPDPRFNEINRNDALMPHVLVSSPIYFHGNMPSGVYWQNQQLTAQRRFWYVQICSCSLPTKN